MKYDFILQYVLKNYYFYYLTIHVKFSLQIVSVGAFVGLFLLGLGLGLSF